MRVVRSEIDKHPKLPPKRSGEKRKSKRDKQTSEQKLLKMCTFKPKINKNYKCDSSSYCKK